MQFYNILFLFVLPTVFVIAFVRPPSKFKFHVFFLKQTEMLGPLSGVLSTWEIRIYFTLQKVISFFRKILFIPSKSSKAEALPKLGGGFQKGQAGFRLNYSMPVWEKHENNKIRLIISHEREKPYSFYEQTLEISELMKVDVFAKDFSISPLTLSEQLVRINGDTFWEWNVTPSKTGIKEVSFTFSIKEKGENFEGFTTVKIFTDYVLVKGNFLEDLKIFFDLNWKWLVGLFVGSGMGWTLFKIYVLKLEK